MLWLAVCLSVCLSSQRHIAVSWRPQLDIVLCRRTSECAVSAVHLYCWRALCCFSLFCVLAALWGSPVCDTAFGVSECVSEWVSHTRIDMATIFSGFWFLCEVRAVSGKFYWLFLTKKKKAFCGKHVATCATPICNRASVTERFCGFSWNSVWVFFFLQNLSSTCEFKKMIW